MNSSARPEKSKENVHVETKCIDVSVRVLHGCHCTFSQLKCRQFVLLVLATQSLQSQSREGYFGEVIAC